MKLKLWGVRGSLPAPVDSTDYESRARSIIEHTRRQLKKNKSADTDAIFQSLPRPLQGIVGGETTCVEIQSGSEQLIFDMGTGARKLGYDMLSEGRKGDIHILMTHTHWDHIQGFPFFAPAFMPDNHLHFYSSIENLEDRFIRQQSFDYFPVSFDAMMSQKTFHTIKPGQEFSIGDRFTIRTEPLIHPGGSAAFRVTDSDGKCFIFATDTEFYGPDLDDLIQEKKPFFQGADLLLMDAQYSLKESEQKIGWGHTCMVIAVDCAIEWEAKKLLLTHHEPAHDDTATYSLYEDALKHLKEKHGSKMKVELALQGRTYTV